MLPVRLFSLFFLLVILVFVNIFLLIRNLGGRTRSSCTSSPPTRHDCLPDHMPDSVRQAVCKERGCVWDESADDIHCFYPTDYVNYDIVSSQTADDRIDIVLRKTSRASGFRKDIQNVRISAIGIDDDVIDLRIEEFVPPRVEYKRWKPHFPVLNLTGVVREAKWKVTLKDPDISIHRKSNNERIIHINIRQLIFSDQFIQAIIHVPSMHLYGFGERMGRHRKTLEAGQKHRKFLFWNHRTPEKEPSHGSHPFYLMYEKMPDFHAHGVLFLNSHASDVTLREGQTLTYRTIGGDMRFLIFMGPHAVDVVRQKARVTGHSPLPSYWSLGFGLSRSGYGGIDKTKRVLDKNLAAGIPVDVQYVDIEYTKGHNTLSVDHKRYGNIMSFGQELHSSHRRLIPVLDMEISSHAPPFTQTRHAFRTGMEMNVFIKNYDKSLMLTKHRNPRVVIPDFTHPNISSWWTQQLSLFHERDMPFDGLWLDVNEPDVKWTPHARSKCPYHNVLNSPQYNPVHPMSLMMRTICLSSRHWTGTHYDLHNEHPVHQTMHSFNALKHILPNRRPFILSRATTTGAGAYVSHWSGDIEASFAHMRSTISAVLDFNLFSIPMTGGDICGFKKNSNRELCARWHALGAFYPLARNHNDRQSIPQDPVAMGKTVTQAARKSLGMRYELLPYLYTLFYLNSESGDPVARSLKMNFQKDSMTDDIDDQMMWGCSLLISPVVKKGVTSISPYFPAGIWYDYRSGREVASSVTGVRKRIQVPFSDISVTVRGGSVLPLKLGSQVSKTADHRNMPFTLLVALNEKEEASGLLFWDDGDGDSVINKQFFLIEFTVRNSSLSSEVLQKFDNSGNMSLLKVMVYGVKGQSFKGWVKSGDQEEIPCDSSLTPRDAKLAISMPTDFAFDNNFVLRWEPA